MIKKMQTYLNLVIIIFAIIAIFYFIFISIRNFFEVPERINMEEIKSYINDKNLVKDNTIYYNLKSCSENFALACVNQNYDDLYEILAEKYKKVYSKSEIKETLKKYNEYYFIVVDEQGLGAYYEYFKNAYLYENDLYIVEMSAGEQYKSLYLIIDMDESTGNYNYIVVDN